MNLSFREIHDVEVMWKPQLNQAKVNYLTNSESIQLKIGQRKNATLQNICFIVYGSFLPKCDAVFVGWNLISFTDVIKI